MILLIAFKSSVPIVTMTTCESEVSVELSNGGLPWVKVKERLVARTYSEAWNVILLMLKLKISMVSVKLRMRVPLLRSSWYDSNSGLMLSSVKFCTCNALSLRISATSFPFISRIALLVIDRNDVLSSTASPRIRFSVFKSSRPNSTATMSLNGVNVKVL